MKVQVFLSQVWAGCREEARSSVPSPAQVGWAQGNCTWPEPQAGGEMSYKAKE